MRLTDLGSRSRAAASSHREDLVLLPGRLLGTCSGHVHLGGDPEEDPEHTGGNYVSVAWEYLGVSLEELEEVCVDREVWISLLRHNPR